MPSDTIREEAIADGRAAFDRSDWSAVARILGALDAEAPLDAEDLERLAHAWFWLRDTDVSIDLFQRAFTLRFERGEARDAARLAIELCHRNFVHRRTAVALGWAERADRLLDGLGDCSEAGWLGDLRALVALYVAGDLDAAEREYAEVSRIGRVCGDVDLIAASLVGLGTVRVRAGDVAEGLRLVDEAMTDAIAGRLGPFTTARIYCLTIGLCQALGDPRRAYEWTEAAASCSARPGMSDFPGDCQLHRAELTRLRGDWSGAEAAVREVMDDLESWDLGHVGQAWYVLGEIALRRDDLESADDAFARAAASDKDPQPGLAMLRLVQGDEAIADALLRTAVANAGDGDACALGQLLPVMVEVQIARGELSEAAAASDRLTGIASAYGTVVLEAQAAMARARVALAQNRADVAATEARAAVSLWRDAGAPHEAAQAQYFLADAANRAGEVAVAIIEVEAAAATFSALGAPRDLAAAERLRARLGDFEAGHQVRRTFMFTDVVDSTRFVAAMGDAQWAGVLRWHDTTIRTLLAECGGTEVKQRGGGDGFFAVFHTPSDAIACAISIQQRFAEHRDAHGFAPEVRIGVHEADALLSQGDFAGLGVHAAARIADLAGAGDIVASEATAGAAAPDMVTAVESVELRGVPGLASIQRIRWKVGS